MPRYIGTVRSARLCVVRACYIAISHGDRFKRTGPVARRGLDHKINRSIEVPQHSFALSLACLLDYFRERGYCRTLGVVRFVVRFNAKVKVGPVEQHLVSKGFPDAKEISLLIQLDRVISEWITRAIIRAGRRRETNHNCDNRYKCCDMHIQDAPSAHAEPAPTRRKPRGPSLSAPDTIRRHK